MYRSYESCARFSPRFEGPSTNKTRDEWVVARLLSSSPGESSSCDSAAALYEVEYLMAKYDLSINRALELIAKHGGTRKNIERELDAVNI